MSRDKITCVTSFGKLGMDLYAEEMVSSFIELWSSDITLKVYLDDLEDHNKLPQAANVEYLLLDDPVLLAFKKRNQDNPRKNGLPSFDQDDSGYFGKNKEGKWKFQYDAIRFCHKVFALAMGAKNAEGLVLWLDGDTKTFARVNKDVIETWLPHNKFSGFLDRPDSFTETGFHIFDMDHAIAKDFFDRWLLYYRDDSIFNLVAWTDCHTYDAARRQFDQESWFNLSPVENGPSTAGHVFINGPLGAYMDHMKGKRKLNGKSSVRDLFVKRAENYWRDK